MQHSLFDIIWSNNEVAKFLKLYNSQNPWYRLKISNRQAKRAFILAAIRCLSYFMMHLTDFSSALDPSTLKMTAYSPQASILDYWRLKGEMEALPGVVNSILPK